VRIFLWRLCHKLVAISERLAIITARKDPKAFFPTFPIKALAYPKRDAKTPIFAGAMIGLG
jgi:hypothetical protein